MSNMTTEETFKFLELYQAENCLWNPKNKNHKNKNVVIDSWKRISDTMGIPVHELKKKKDNLLTTFRKNIKRKNASICSGSGTDDDEYQPIWIFYDAMAAFLEDIYDSSGLMKEKANTSKVETCDNRPDAKNEDHDYVDFPTTSQNEPIMQLRKRRAKDPLELQETSKNMRTAFNASANKEHSEEDDECDLFCKMLAKQIKEYPKHEREEIMYELHGVMINRRRGYYQ